VLAAIVQLLERTSHRIGNERYATDNDSFGLTTMRNRHVKVSGDRIEFQFRGKSGKFHRIAVDDDPQLARLVQRCRDLPGQDLFQYLDDAGEVQSIGSSDVNDYLKEIAGREISTKDFRTWNGSLIAASMLRRCERVGITHVRRRVREASLYLGNTPAICRKSYVHPRVLDPAHVGKSHRGRAAARPPRGLRAEEGRVARYPAAAQTGEQNCHALVGPASHRATRYRSTVKRWFESMYGARML
jgi:DNA topoisomerase-1